MSTFAQKRKRGDATDARHQASPQDNKCDVRMKSYRAEKCTQTMDTQTMDEKKTDPHDEPRVNNQLTRLHLSLVENYLTFSLKQVCHPRYYLVLT
jgi:hypothetical protein